MLIELRVENLLLIERAHLRLAGGLNVLTGETGAGKTVLAHALDLLLGGRPRQGIVRPGASEGYVEGTFLVSMDTLDELASGSVLERIDPDRPDSGEVELVLARRIGSDGRTRAYLNGRTASVADLREVGAALIAFYGQHEHRRLMLAAAQLHILDAFCGEPQQRLLRQCADALSELRQAEREVERLSELRGSEQRELELLAHEIEEIDRVDPKPDERALLLAERERLRQLDALRAAAAQGIAALSGDERENPGAVQLIASATANVEALAGLDASLDCIAERLRSLAIEAQDLARELHSTAAQLDGEDGQLELLEGRLAEIERLMRKHGGDIEAVLAHRSHALARRAQLLQVERCLEESLLARSAADGRLQSVVQKLRVARHRAAGQLERAVSRELAALAMPEASFEVRLAERAPSAHGGDAVELMLAANPGVPAAPLREAASGGELSRTMLALLSVSHSAGSRSSLVFDEVDAGIGGQTARAVGERLRALAVGRQVICITHLPQIASLADAHFTISKDTSSQPARAEVRALAQDELVGELVRMLGAPAGDAAARLHAEELLKAA